MSVGIGVSDILFFVNQTLILYGKCRGAPAELQAAGRNVEQMRTALEILGAATEDRQSFVAKMPAVTLMIKHEIKPLRQDLLAMNTILDDYIDKSKDMGVIGRVKFAVLDRNKLQSIQSNLTKSRTNFGLMLDLINMKAQDQHARNENAITKKLEAILDKQTKEADARKAEAKSREEKGDAQLESILQILEERLPAASRPETGEVSPDQVLNQLETELQRLGLSKEKAQAARSSAAQALTENHNALPAPTLLHPKEESRDIRRKSNPSPVVKQELHRSSSARNPAVQSSSPQNLPEKTKQYRILCLDSTHGVRAVLTHAYLETLRVWTANRSGRWLFMRAHSAGRTIRTNPNSCLDPTTIQGVMELLPHDGYLWAADYPNETQRIVTRMKSYNLHGFTKADLSTYDIILCFTRTDANHLSDIKTDTPHRARVVVLPGCREISSEECAKDPTKIKELISLIKVAVKGFIGEELGDWSIEMQNTKFRRTLEFVLPGRQAGPGVFFAPKNQLSEWANKSGCMIQITKYKGSDKEVLVSIVGPPKRLDEAAALIKASA